MALINDNSSIQRIIQEAVPGKELTIAHVIASPMQDIYKFLKLKNKEAIGILTLTPCETSIIAADIATKAADVEIGFLDRSSGSLIITGDVQSVETALNSVADVLRDRLGFSTVPVTKT